MKSAALFALLVTTLLLCSCDSVTPIAGQLYPPYSGRFVIFDKDDIVDGLEYEAIADFNFHKHSPGGQERWLDISIDKARVRGANGIIHCRKGQSFALGSITFTGPYVTGTMVHFTDVEAAIRYKETTKPSDLKNVVK